MKAVILTPKGSVISMRVSPNANAEVIADLESGDMVDAKATQGNWTNIVWEGTEGWVDSSFVVLESDTTGDVGKLFSKFKGTLKKNATAKKVTSKVTSTQRANSGTKRTRIGGKLREAMQRIKNNVKAAANTATDAVKASNVSGIDDAYNADEQLALNGLFDSIKSAFRKVKKAVGFGGLAGFSKGQTLYVNTQKDPLTMRSTASTSGTKITSIPRGSAVSVADATLKSANGYQWLKVTYGTKSGFVATKYLSASKPSTSTSSSSTSKSTTTTTKTTTTTTNSSTTSPSKSTTTTNSSSTTNNTPSVTNDNNSSTDNQSNNKQMGLSDNAKKYIKWGVIGVGVLAAGYFGYKAFSGNGGKKKSGRKGLSGIKKKPLRLN
ncbi:MAG: SH3 domain-containing protein [Bacteroidales bacterium]|nr:SH3 domain-containing protein [Bacteroidales bacterium]